MVREFKNKLCTSLGLLFVSAGMVSAQSSRPADAVATGLHVAVFTCNVTPPLGHPLVGGWVPAASRIDDPLLAKGIVLKDAGGTYVLCAIDWCEVRNDAYELFRTKLAEATGTTLQRVAVHTTHSHSAPLTDLRAQEILADVPGAPAHADLPFLRSAADRTARAARLAMGNFRKVTQIGHGSAKVDRVASNRRVRLPDGTMGVRLSSCTDPFMVKAPEGLIDPLLRTVSFYDGDKPIVQLHYYATHPQTYYGKGEVTWDMPGIVRERLQKETGAFQIYFDGCGGNITMGKYNDGTHERRIELAERVYQAMRQAIRATQREPVTPIRWTVRPLRFSPRLDEQYSEAKCHSVIKDEKAGAFERIQAAMNLANWERFKSDRPIDLTLLAIGSVRLVHLPGESFVEYQLLIEQQRPDLFVAVAAYGDCFTGYICTEAAFTEGGYEPTQSCVSPTSERYYRRALVELMSAGDPGRKNSGQGRPPDGAGN